MAKGCLVYAIEHYWFTGWRTLERFRDTPEGAEERFNSQVLKSPETESLRLVEVRVLDQVNAKANARVNA